MTFTRRLRCLPGVVALLACAPVAAYDQAGHFYTAFALARTAQAAFPDRDRLTVTFCAQLPDMASDLDAVSVYKAAAANPWRWLRWATSDLITGDDLRRMVTIQQLLHGLTGGHSVPLKAVAKATVTRLQAAVAGAGAERAEALCALGFGLHLLADSHAHEQLDDAGKPAADRKMYVTGRGHAGDWHDPDHVFCARYVEVGLSTTRNCRFDDGKEFRFEAWRGLWADAGGLLDSLGAAAPAGRGSLLDRLLALGREAAPTNGWNEEGMRLALAPGREPPSEVGRLAAFIVRQEADQRGCAKVLAAAANERLPPFVDGKAPDCHKAWARFHDVVREAFRTGDPKARAELEGRPDLDGKVYCRQPLEGGRCD